MLSTISLGANPYPDYSTIKMASAHAQINVAPNFEPKKIVALKNIFHCIILWYNNVHALHMSIIIMIMYVHVPFSVYAQDH